MRHAQYQVIKDEPGEPLVIRDVGPWDQHRTVTNDVEHVVGHLARAGRLPDGRELHYYDSEDVLDRIVVLDGKFCGFAPIATAEERRQAYDRQP